VAVVLRLNRSGRKNRPFHRIVVADKQMRRDGRFLEIVGNYDKLVEPPLVTLKEDRVRHWIEQGAKPTLVVRSLITKKIPGFIEAIEEGRRSKIRAKRKARKERAVAKGTNTTKKEKTKAKTKKAPAKKAAAKE
jgi:small subunit ribosomal protein S16